MERHGAQSASSDGRREGDAADEVHRVGRPQPPSARLGDDGEDNVAPYVKIDPAINRPVLDAAELAYDVEEHDKYVRRMNFFCGVCCCQCGGSCWGCCAPAEERDERETLRREALQRQAVLIGELLSIYERDSEREQHDGAEDATAAAAAATQPRRGVSEAREDGGGDGEVNDDAERVEPAQPPPTREELARRAKSRMKQAASERRRYPVILPQDWLVGVELYVALGAFREEPARLQALCLRLPPPPVAKLQQFHHWMRFAVAPLGQYLLMLQRPGSALLNYPKSWAHSLRRRGAMPDTGLVAVARRCRVGPKSILLASLTSHTYRPAFVVVDDPATGCLVVGVRGTMSVSDAFTDLDGAPRRFEVRCCAGSPAGRGTVIAGQAHAGVLLSGQNLCDAVLPTLRLACEKRRAMSADGREPVVMVTGHSLGGGASAALALMLQAHLPNVHGVCFAPPPVMTAAAAEQCKSFLECVVRGNDAVPRMSLPAMAHFLRIAHLGKKRLGPLRRLALMLQCGGCCGGCPYPRALYRELQRMEHAIENQRLFVPGRVFFITEPSERFVCCADGLCGTVTCVGRCPDACCCCSSACAGDSDAAVAAIVDDDSDAPVQQQRIMREIDASELRTLIGRKGIIDHHLPWGYEAALLSLLRKAGAPSLRRSIILEARAARRADQQRQRQQQRQQQLQL